MSKDNKFVANTKYALNALLTKLTQSSDGFIDQLVQEYPEKFENIKLEFGDEVIDPFLLAKAMVSYYDSQYKEFKVAFEAGQKHPLTPVAKTEETPAPESKIIDFSARKKNDTTH